jgi:ABC-type dipeptide/oligopeptide/nickel transport system permease component
LLQFLIRRLVSSVFVVFGVSVAAFSMVHLVPGDPVAIMLGERATPADVARLRGELGLDEPLPVQYLDYVSRAVRGDFGESIRSGQPVLGEISDRVAPTLELALAAMAIAVALGILTGVTAATSKSSAADFGTMAVSLVGLSLPTFWSGLLLIYLFGLKLGWFPVSGAGGPQALLLPAVTLALPAAAVLARLTRSSMLEVLGQDYVRTARSKGLPEDVVVYKHALQNAFIPVLTIMGLQFGALLGGSVIVESVFARPGLGRFAVDAILARDFPVVQAIVLLAGVVFVLVNLLVDILYSVLDPRISLR